MKLNQAISTLRESIKAFSDEAFEDEFLYDLFKRYRALFLKRSRDINNFLYWQSFCMPVCKDTYHDCECIDDGCFILKSTYIVPNVISNDYLNIVNLDGVSIPRFTPDDMKTKVKYSPILKGRVGWYIENSKLIIWNTMTYEAVLVRGIFEDPLAIKEIPYCNERGEVIGDCAFDPFTQEFPVEESLVPVIIQSCLQELRLVPPLEDRRNDGKHQNFIPQIPSQARKQQESED